MLNIRELEQRHFKYKIKSLIPYVTIFFSISIISGIFITFFLTDTFKMQEKNASIQPTAVEQPKPVAVPKKVAVVPQEIEVKPEPKIEETTTKVVKKQQPAQVDTVVQITDKKLILSPSMNFINTINQSTALSNKNTYKEKVMDQPKAVVKPKEITPKVQQQQKQNLDQKQNSSIEIKKNNTYEDINHVIKRFKKNNNPALSLFIAKKYYEIGEYAKAYNYALITNEINSNIEVSWIIFSKSLVKLHKKNLAIKTLKKYIRHTDSNKAKLLLDDILAGKLDAN